MSRWTIKEIYYFSHDGQRRTVDLHHRGMTIITGPSGTGKSAIIETVDYCLCSGECNIPRYVRDRCSCVGVLWTNGPTDLLVCRLVPRPAGSSSHHMYVLFGTEIEVPKDYRKLRGPLSLDAARKQIQSLFRIGDVYQLQESELDTPERISIRHATPYVFISKNVIDSNSILLHGMEDPRFYPDIVNSLPYFLGIVDEQTLKHERELRSLTLDISREVRRLANIEQAKSSERGAVTALLAEAVQAGVIEGFATEANLADLLPILARAARWRRRRTTESTTEIRQQVQGEQESLYERLRELKNRRTIAQRMNSLADAFGTTVSLEKQRLEVFELFDEHARSNNCPVCAQAMDEPSIMADSIQKAVQKITAEQMVLQQHKPKFDAALVELDNEIGSVKTRLTDLDRRLAALIAEDDRAREARDADARANQVVGRISYFLDNLVQMDSRESQERLERMRDRLSILHDYLDSKARERTTTRIEDEISASASSVMRSLPLEEPCTDADLNFHLKHVEVTLTSKSSSVPTNLKSVGSDQNYLAIHIALYLALHRFFSRQARPVPGVVFVDQVSRPYFPPQKHPDVVPVRGEATDSETAAVRQHFDLLFREVNDWPDLQIIVLEHALFEDDPQYMAAVKHQWSKDPDNKLIPSAWPVNSA